MLPGQKDRAVKIFAVPVCIEDGTVSVVHFFMEIHHEAYEPQIAQIKNPWPDVGFQVVIKVDS